jgi:response regulator RpfG family c-di-GMP phosphodiesterase
LLRTVENTRTGLKKIIEATSKLYEINSLGQLATGILTQLAALISHDEGVASENAAECFAATEKRGSINIYAAFGVYEPHIGKSVYDVSTPTVADIIKRSLKEKTSIFTDNDFLGYFRTKNGMENLIYLKTNRLLKAVDRDLIEVFASNIASAFENLFLNREITKSQKDVTFTLGEIIETRSGDAGQHVRRVAESSRLLAQLAGLSEVDCELLRTASPMHDLGKIGIPDAVLNKPGKLNAEEWQMMQSHTEIGCKVLKNTDQSIIKTGGLICSQHHEKWDGSGYPQGLAGEEIHIFARITAIIDVFDALTHSRVYKEAWSVEKTLDQIKKDRGTHFDPTLADLFLNNIESFLEIQKAFDE